MRRHAKILLGVGSFVAVCEMSGAAVAVYLAVSYTNGQKHLQRGYAEMSAAHYDNAVAEYTAALRCWIGGSSRAYAFGCRGSCEARQHRTDAAFADLSEALRLNPELVFGYIERGALRLADNDLNAAWQDYSRAIELEPNAAPAFLGRGTISFRREDWAAAVRDFSEAIRANPRDPIAYLFRGEAYGRAQEFGAAFASFDAAIRTAPDLAVGYLYRGRWYHARRDLYKALADFSTAIRLAPTSAEAYVSRYQVYAEQQNWRSAAVDCTELLQLNLEDEAALRSRGIAFKFAGDYDAAISDFTELIRRTQAREAYELRAGALVAKGRYEEAIADYQQGAAQSGPRCQAKGFAWLLATCPDHRFRHGDEAVARATEDCEHTDWKDCDCLDTLAAAYAECGDFTQAVRYEEQALASHLGSPEMRLAFQTRLSFYQCGIPYRDAQKPFSPPRPAPTNAKPVP